MVQSLMKSRAAETADGDDDFDLPLATEKDVEELESLLQDGQKRKSLVSVSCFVIEHAHITINMGCFIFYS